MTLASAYLLRDQAARSAAVLLQVLLSLLLPAGGRPLAVPARVASLAGALVVTSHPALGDAALGSLPATPVPLTARPLLPPSPAAGLLPPGLSWPLPDEGLLVAVSPARVSLVAARQHTSFTLSAL